jgi:ABC-2 type transport system ATP-binding protein
VVAGLRKSYGAQLALESCDASLDAGEIVGLLGPNGAGKTTTMSIIAGVLAPDAGTVHINGYDLALAPQRAQRYLGFAPQSLALYPSLTPRENLVFFARMQGLSRSAAQQNAAELLDAAGLVSRADALSATFSGGMKRRLNLICAMVHRPSLLLLDEPTAGVDPQSRERIFAMLERAAAAGTACLYSTHYMEEAERLCQRVILLDHGRIVGQGSVAQLIAQAGIVTRIELKTRAPLPSGWTKDLPGVIELGPDPTDPSGVALGLDSASRVFDVMKAAEAAAIEVLQFNLRRANLHDAFIKLTGHAMRDSANP